MSGRLKSMSAGDLALELRKVYCLSGAQFCAGELEASWIMIGELEAQLQLSAGVIEAARNATNFGDIYDMPGLIELLREALASFDTPQQENSTKQLE